MFWDLKKVDFLCTIWYHCIWSCQSRSVNSYMLFTSFGTWWRVWSIDTHQFCLWRGQFKWHGFNEEHVFNQSFWFCNDCKCGQFLLFVQIFCLLFLSFCVWLFDFLQFVFRLWSVKRMTKMEFELVKKWFPPLMMLKLVLGVTRPLEMDLMELCILPHQQALLSTTTRFSQSLTTLLSVKTIHYQTPPPTTPDDVCVHVSSPVDTSVGEIVAENPICSSDDGKLTIMTCVTAISLFSFANKKQNNTISILFPYPWLFLCLGKTHSWMIGDKYVCKWTWSSISISRLRMCELATDSKSDWWCCWINLNQCQVVGLQQPHIWSSNSFCQICKVSWFKNENKRSESQEFFFFFLVLVEDGTFPIDQPTHVGVVVKPLRGDCDCRPRQLTFVITGGGGTAQPQQIHKTTSSHVMRWHKNGTEIVIDGVTYKVGDVCVLDRREELVAQNDILLTLTKLNKVFPCTLLVHNHLDLEMCLEHWLWLVGIDCEDESDRTSTRSTMRSMSADEPISPRSVSISFTFHFSLSKWQFCFLQKGWMSVTIYQDTEQVGNTMYLPSDYIETCIDGSTIIGASFNGTVYEAVSLSEALSVEEIRDRADQTSFCGPFSDDGHTIFVCSCETSHCVWIEDLFFVFLLCVHSQNLQPEAHIQLVTDCTNEQFTLAMPQDGPDLTLVTCYDDTQNDVGNVLRNVDILSLTSSVWHECLMVWTIALFWCLVMKRWSFFSFVFLLFACLCHPFVYMSPFFFFSLTTVFFFFWLLSILICLLLCCDRFQHLKRLFFLGGNFIGDDGVGSSCCGVSVSFEQDLPQMFCDCHPGVVLSSLLLLVVIATMWHKIKKVGLTVSLVVHQTVLECFLFPQQLKIF